MGEGWKRACEAAKATQIPDWCKCSLLSAGDVQSVKSVEEMLDSVFHVSDEATRHMVGLVKALAMRVIELETKTKGEKRG